MSRVSHVYFRLSAIVFVFLASHSCVARAQELSFSQVISSATTIPNGNGTDTFDRFRAPSVDNGRIAFSAGTGVYTIGGNGIQIIANNSGFGGRTLVSVIPQVSISGNEVAFFGAFDATVSSPSEAGIFVGNVLTGDLRTVVNTNTLVPGLSGPGVTPGVTDSFEFGSLFNFAISDGTVIFTGDNMRPSFPGGVYVERDGVLSVVADSNTQIPGTSINFNNFTGVAIDGDNLFFSHITPSGQFVSRDGVIDSFGVGAGSISVSGDNFAQVTNDGVVLSVDGNVRLAFDEDNPQLIDGTRNFASVNNLSLDGEDFAFTSLDTFNSNRRNGLFAQIDGSLVTVVEEGDVLNGLRVEDIEFSENGFRDGQIAFAVDFTDGSEAIFVASVVSVPEPTSLLILSGGVLLIGLRRGRSSIVTH